MSDKFKILVIDDEAVVRDSCRMIIADEDHIIECAENGRQGLEILKKENFSIVILDLKMPGISGMEVLEQIKFQYPETIVIVITGYPTIDSAVEAMKLGAYDFLPKPFTPEALRLIVKRAIEKTRLSLENMALRSELMHDQKTEIVIGRSKKMREIKNIIEKVAPTDTTVLITGESGTGKEMFARLIHSLSYRKDNVFVTLDCGALVENLFESELFGHTKGSFTGALTTKYGRFEIAKNGSIFLDEIANISPQIQGKLLRALQEREICRIGSSQVISIDVRIIAATNKDIKSAVLRGEFREDLFYRLCVVWIHLPPLRERREDIREFANFFLKKYSLKKKKHVNHISAEAMKLLMNYEWPGNIRELENTIERAVVLTEGTTIKPENLFYYGFSVNKKNDDYIPIQSIADSEKELIIKTLEFFNWNKGKTAHSLGIDRKTLYRNMKKYNIER
ncbi:MAG: sigma-54-dependent transcriptional regulator [bacterium]